jgi:molybdopterin synthase sulfur carrier subunit
MLKTTPSTVTIKVFGQLSDSTRKAEMRMQVADTDDLQKQMRELYPELQGKNYLIAINEFMINENTILEENDTVALLPPFSGG